ncbi:MAG: FAD-binding protein [Bacteroidales bacterium]|jgi:uncharacterized FAD-dependent dehydrogenase|nr:FAD-binding protein [Bacteroidales bacterium]
MKEVEVPFGVHAHPSKKEILAACASRLGIPPFAVGSGEILRKSLDARGRNLLYRYRVKITIGDEPLIEPFRLMPYENVAGKPPVIIVGCGPAGLFAALACLQHGLKPVILERGRDVRTRKRDIAEMYRTQKTDPDSNYCFGEGGAGTYSDGKLYTRSTKRGDVRLVLHQFVNFGADESILYDAHPHIGTDLLPRVVENMRNCIIEHGGEVHFETKAVDFLSEGGNWKVVCEKAGADSVPGRNGSDEGLVFESEYVILATGHSARDIYELFAGRGWEIEAKDLALGVRVEHPQSVINNSQYHGKYTKDLPAAEYSLVCQVEGRGVFSFCMCPGGILVPSSTEDGEVVLNGMSSSLRNSKWANAGVVVPVSPSDVPQFDKYGPLSMMYFQHSVEQRIFKKNGGTLKAPAQRMRDFTEGRRSTTLPESSYAPGVYPANLNEYLPKFVSGRLKKAFRIFGSKIRGYYSNDALLVAVESRTSSPVRIVRDAQTMQHVSLKNLFPCGEGAGYAGGIVSSALDGINIVERIADVEGSKNK